MPTLWFSYSTLYGLDAPEPLNSPYARTWHLGRFLRAKAGEIGYDFEYRNLDDNRPVDFSPEDIAIGHTWLDGGFMHHALEADIRAAFVLQPFSRYMARPKQTQDYIELFDKADHLFLICGDYWFDDLDDRDNPYHHLRSKATRIDSSVNPDLHVYRKQTWNPPGKRGFLAISNDRWAKGLDKVAELARIAGFRLGHVGSADRALFEHVPQFRGHAPRDFTSDQIEWFCQEYDFFLAMGRYDANPSTLAETAHWGLVGICTPQSGYYPGEPFYEVRLDDMPFNLRQIERLQTMSDYDLQRKSEALRTYAKERFSWDKLKTTIWTEVARWL